MAKYILQSWGIGDVIMSMTAVRSLNDKILWGVRPEYVEGLNRAYPDIFFIDFNQMKIDYNRRDRYMIEDMEVIPLRWQDVPLKECMMNKYVYFGMDWQTWKKNASFVRNRPKEFALMDALGIARGEKFNLINTEFGSDPNRGRVGNETGRIIVPPNGLRNIDQRSIPGFSLFDWCGVFEQAETIYTVSSASLYLFELLPYMSAKEIHLFIRRPFEKSHANYEYLLSKNKNYILEP